MRSLPSLALLLLPLVGLVSAAGCDAPHETFRAVFITDTHVIGPEYSCCHENGDNDNASIVRTVERLTAVRDTVNAMKPAPAMVFVLGDVIHAAHVSRDPAWYREHENAYSIARDLFAGFAMPVYLAMGNHDYEVDCGSSATFDRSFSEARFGELLGQPPYQAVDHAGWKFLVVNSQRGATFDVTHPNCNTGFASVGAEQMAWAETQLAEGKPTVVMSHYMRILYDAVETGAHTSFPALLDDHRNMKAFFAGHSHRWLDMSGFNGDVTHWVLGGTRYDPNNFWVVEFDGSARTMRILDERKAILNSSCADTWSYDGEPKPVLGAVSTGDCVSSF
jgi:3',5'-cyclic-AMP phosphodiesterase